MTCRKCRPTVNLNCKYPCGPDCYERSVELCPLHDGSIAEKLAEALRRMTEHREYQLQMAGVTRRSDDIEQAKAALSEYEKGKG